ncbi:hypothetical protein E1H13_04845 [Nodosilinea sp. P-1105]|nr:hypothetical protein [Nodosilinea sp. P-1105]
MNSMGCQITCCSRCRHYTPEGRRGGQCGQLGVPVQGRWQACSLGVPVFLTPLPELATLEFLPKPLEIRVLEPANTSTTTTESTPPAIATYAQQPSLLAS